MNTIDSSPKGRPEMLAASSAPAPPRAASATNAAHAAHAAGSSGPANAAGSSGPAGTAPPAAKKSSAPSTDAVPVLRGEALAREAARITKELADLTPHVLFSVDRESGQVVVRVLDPETRELVRQIPPQELMEIRQRMDAYLGMLADEVA